MLLCFAEHVVSVTFPIAHFISPWLKSRMKLQNKVWQSYGLCLDFIYITLFILVLTEEKTSKMSLTMGRRGGGASARSVKVKIVSENIIISCQYPLSYVVSSV